ncbi:adhesion G-protein coupled receptor G1-like isoform X1 [Pleurodeles waltl]|uniref:adhesion G-protein coupled receptor G1-like isoform X1 n=1 Tax=Pleurodeles waltl TaxID=8319 RepID=UPI003709A943
MLFILLTVFLHVTGVFTQSMSFWFCGTRNQSSGGGTLKYESNLDCDTITIVNSNNCLKIIAPFRKGDIVKLQSPSGYYRFCVYWFRKPGLLNLSYGANNYTRETMNMDAAPCRTKICSPPKWMFQNCHRSEVLYNVSHRNNTYQTDCSLHYEMNIRRPCDVQAVQDEVKQIEKLIQQDASPVDPSTAHASLRRVEAALSAVNFSGQSTTFGTGLVRASVIKLNTSSYQGLVLDSKSLLNKSASHDKGSFSVSLPPGLLKNASGDERRLLIVSFESPALFKDQNKSDLLNDQVIGVSVENTLVENLEEPVNITFRHHHSQKCRVPLCVFWDSATPGESGMWNTSGCQTVASHKETECRCDHLTYFAVLMQISSTEIDRHHQRTLTIITYAGCSLSAVASFFAVARYLYSHRNRSKPSDRTIPIHMNLLAAIFFLNLSFMLSWPLSSLCMEGACQAGALFLHSSLLWCFAWMAIEGFNLYKKVVRVFKDSSNMLRLCCLGWGFPPVLVLLIFMIDQEIYGTYSIKLADSAKEDSSATMCWITNPTVHYVVNLGSFSLIFLLNTMMLVAMVRVIMKLKTKKMQQKLQYAWTLAGLSCTLGFTWGLAFFSFGSVSLEIMYAFTVVNSLQGCFIFVWYRVMRRQAQRSETSQVTTDSIRPQSSIRLPEE